MMRVLGFVFSHEVGRWPASEANRSVWAPLGGATFLGLKASGMTDESVKDLTEAAEAEWLETWVEGLGDQRTKLLEPGTAAPEFDLFDEEGINRELASFWADGPALIMFWRHFGCGCGIDRAARLRDEHEDYVAAGLSPVIIGQGEPERAAAYKQKYEIPCTILCDPAFAAYDAYGLANFGIEQVLYDAPEEMWGHSMQVGIGFQAARRQMDRPLVDNPWMSPGEFVVATSGAIAVSYTYQFCENFPDPRVFTTTAKLQ